MRASVHEVVAELEQSPPPIPEEELAEARALLEWMHDDHFTFLGYREYEIRTEGEEDVLALGRRDRASASCASSGEQPHSLSFSQLPPEVRQLAREKNLLNLTKANSRATVHRPAYLDYVGVKRFDENGEVTGRSAASSGLYTHTAYSASPWEIPVLRRKAQRVRRALGPAAREPRPQGAGRDPRDLPARRALPDLGGRALRDRARHPPPRRAAPRAALRPPRRVRPLPLLPRLPAARAVQHREPAAGSRRSSRRRSAGRASTTRRASPSRCWRGSTSSSTRSRARSPSTTSPRSRRASPRRRAPGRTTSATPSSTSSARSAPARCIERYGDAFPGAYRDDFTARQAVPDIERIERLDLRRRPRSQPLRAARLDRRPARLQAPPLRPADPPLRRAAAAREHGRPGQRRAAVRGAAARTRPRSGSTTSVSGTTSAPSSRPTSVRETLPGRVRARLARRGRERRLQPPRPRGAADRARDHDPARDRQVPPPGGQHVQPGVHGGRARRAPGPRARPRRALHASARPGAARRRGRAGARRSSAGSTAIDRRGREPRRGPDPARLPHASSAPCCGRTTSRRTTTGGRSRTSRSSSTRRWIPDLPEPRPMFEVFVYSPRVEAVHLRGGKVARGGIRWSDRREDFRTEVLGLMKAQTVKNAVIVPGRREGRLRRQAAAGRRRPRGAARGGRRVLPDLHPRPARRHRHARGRRGRAAAASRAPRRRRPVPRRRGRQGHGDVLRHRQRDLERVRLLARRRVRLGRLGGLRPQGDGDHGPRRLGVGASATSASSASTSRRPTSPWSGSATCPATCSATGCCSRRHIKLVARVRPPARLPRPRPRSGSELRRARAALPAAGLVLGRLRRGADLDGRRRLPAHGEVDPALARGARRRSASRPSR